MRAANSTIAVLLHSPPAFRDMSVPRRKTENTPDFLNKKNAPTLRGSAPAFIGGSRR
jgi:hypothetical protein